MTDAFTDPVEPTDYDNGATYVTKRVFDLLANRVRGGSNDGRLAVMDIQELLAIDLRRWIGADVVAPPPLPEPPFIDHHAIGYADGFEAGRTSGRDEANQASDRYIVGYDDAVKKLFAYIDRRITRGPAGERAGWIATRIALQAELKLRR